MSNRALDTDEPQGSSPTASDSGSGSEGGGAGLNLDRLAHRSRVIASGDTLYTTRTETVLAHDVLALVERVRTLEAVAEAARAVAKTHAAAIYEFNDATEADLDNATEALVEAVAARLAAGGGAHE